MLSESVWQKVPSPLSTPSSSAARNTLDGTRRVIRPRGVYCHILSTDWRPNAAETSVLTVLAGPAAKWRSRVARLLRPATPQVFSTPVQPDGDRLARLARLVDDGMVRPVIDRYFDGLDAAAEALAYLEQGHARGKVVIRVS